MNETTQYLGECYPELSAESLAELREIGTRFCRPVIANAPSVAVEAVEDEVEDAEAAAA